MPVWKHCYNCVYTRRSHLADVDIFCQSCSGEMIKWTAPALPRSHATTTRHGHPRWLEGHEWVCPTRQRPPPPPPRQSQPAVPTSAAASLFVDGLMNSLTLYDREKTERVDDKTSPNSWFHYSDNDTDWDHNHQDDSGESGDDEDNGEVSEDDDDDEDEEEEEGEDEIEHPGRIPGYWDDETESNILEGEIRPKIFRGHRCRRPNCGEEHPTEMHSLMWHFQEVWTPKHTKGAASRFFCGFCTGRRGPDVHGHTTKDHNKGEWRDHPEVNFRNYTQSMRYVRFANPWYQFHTAKRPFPLCYYDPVNFEVPEDYPVLLNVDSINSGLWYGTSNSVESLQESLERVLQSVAHVDANSN